MLHRFRDFNVGLLYYFCGLLQFSTSLQPPFVANIVCTIVYCTLCNKIFQITIYRTTFGGPFRAKKNFYF